MRNRIVFVLVKFLYAFPFIIFFPPIVKSLYVFLFFLLSVGAWSDIKLNKGFKLLMASCSIFFVYALSLLYSSEPLVGIKMLETKLGMIVIPSSFYFFSPTSKLPIDYAIIGYQKTFYVPVLYTHLPFLYISLFTRTRNIQIFIPLGFFRARQRTCP